MSTHKIQIQDNNGNVYLPETLAELVSYKQKNVSAILDEIIDTIDSDNENSITINNKIDEINSKITTLTSNISNKLDKNSNAVSATKLQNEITISLDGNITGSASFDGSKNITITTSGISAIPTNSISDLF